jgi:hypothetical protein
MPSSVLSPVVSSTWEGQQLTHMPFLCRAEGQFLLVFARSLFAPRRVPQYSLSGTTRIWRLAWTLGDPHTGHWGLIHPLRTGLQANEVECSPCVSFEAGHVHVSFIATANHGTGLLRHHLFRMSGPSLDRLGPAVRVSPDECFSGFWRPDLAAFSSGRDGEIRLCGTINARLETGFQEIARVSFDADQPELLLITGVLPGETSLFGGQPQPHTIIYDVARDAVLGEVQVGGAPAYKPSMAGGRLAHVQPHPASRRRESWTVAFEDQLALVPTPVLVRQFR